MKRARLSQSAVLDLDEIAEFISAPEGFGNPALARKPITELRAKCRAIACQPRIYRFGPDVRRAVFKRYLILFRERPDEVRIERILHGARDVAAILGPQSKA